MNVYRDTNDTVTFEHPFGQPLVATVYRAGVQIYQSDPIAPVEGRYSLDLTFRHTQYDGPLDITWTATDPDSVGGTFIRTTTVNVITPIVPLSKLKTVYDVDNPPEGELKELENTTRTFIEAYTGQRFGYRIGILSISGTGEKRVALPERLISLTSVSGGPPGYFSVSNNGWYLYMGNKNWLVTKEVPPEEFDTNPTMMTKGVIHVPDTYWKKFRVGAVYDIEGEWGYYTVPNEVQEAAMLLANDFLCGDIVYRDRYLESVKYADTNMTFNQGAYRGTGNARADQLLDGYRRQGMVII